MFYAIYLLGIIFWILRGIGGGFGGGGFGGGGAGSRW